MKTHEVIICILTGAITVMIAHSIGSGAALLAAMCFVLAVVCIVALYWSDPVEAPPLRPVRPTAAPTIRLTTPAEPIEPATWQTERLDERGTIMSNHDGALRSYNAVVRVLNWAHGAYDTSTNVGRDGIEDLRCEAGNAHYRLAQSLGVPEYALTDILQPNADGWYVDDAAYQAWLDGTD